MPAFNDDFKYISEFKTRKKIIDPLLENAGWLWEYVKEEVNSVKSDFKNKELTFFEGSPEKGERFIDYLLLDQDYTVLAIIEAKRFSKNPENGRIQARTYSKDIEKQIGFKIPIFLTNGHEWLYMDEDGIERKVSGPFSQEDLKRKRDLYQRRENPTNIGVNPRIVDRPRNVKIVKELSHHFSAGHRSALVQMATGTGKTRVAMAVIDILIKSNMVRNVLFVADRISLVNQTKSSGFQRFFREPICDLRQEFSTSARLYVSTVQTLMGGDPKLFERFSPGFFDLIVFDEAHRSYYDKNNLIFEYFDTIKIGLTATPREHESRNTYKLFECEDGKPTVEYSYDEAVLEGVLVPYKAEIIDTNVLALGIIGSTLTSDLKDQLRRQEIDPETFEPTGSQFDRVFMDDRTNELIIREFMALCYKSDEGKPTKSIFFCASQRHAKFMKAMFGTLFPYLSSEVQAITSSMSRAEDEVKRFRGESEPRIALSVGMLDTGVDIPEVCNLVFIKPVFSSVRFWQMVGRGTRNLDACKHPEWLPNREKNDFLIFDFAIGGHSNIHVHNFTPTAERKAQDSVITKIFKNRVDLLKKRMSQQQRKIIDDKILQSLEGLDEGSFIVRPKLPTLAKIKGDKFNLQEYIEDLRDEIAPLMILEQGDSAKVSSFILQTEKLFGFILERKKDKISKIEAYVQKMARNILQKDNLSEIKENKEKIITVFQDSFWEDLTFENVEFIIKEIAPLMKYYEPERGIIVQSDAPDFIISRDKFEKEVIEDEELKKLLDENPIVRKIKDGEGITSLELLELERQLSELKPGLTIDNIQNFQHKDFFTFLREMLKLSYQEDPKELIEKRFDEYILEKHDYNPKQIELLILLKKIFAERKRIELTDFASPPFADERPLDYFGIDDLKDIVSKCNDIRMY
ncbi:MAG: DEAD/DEAH box helicase [Euryarchaeota archaeon]|nr:DEAD/DEAH box helicase [Euryarchaeota archaeon]